MRTFKSLLAVTALAMVAVSGQAYAHAHLKSALPAVDGSASASPAELDLTFTEGLEIKFSGVKVSGPDNAEVSTGPAALKPGDSTTLVVPVTKPLTAGIYTVDWHALSTDGHKTQGSYKFTVAP